MGGGVEVGEGGGGEAGGWTVGIAGVALGVSVGEGAAGWGSGDEGAEGRPSTQPAAAAARSTTGRNLRIGLTITDAIIHWRPGVQQGYAREGSRGRGPNPVAGSPLPAKARGSPLRAKA